MTLIHKSDIPAVALDEMNDVHYEELGIINELYELVKSAIADKSVYPEIDKKLEELHTHTRAHFANEERLMREYNFPPYPIHKYNHDQFLAQMKGRVADWQKFRDINQLKQFLEQDLVDWLNNHISTLDMVTAMFLNEKMG